MKSQFMRSVLLLLLALAFLNSTNPKERKGSSELRAAIDSSLVQLDLGNYTQAELWLEKSRALIGKNPSQADYFNLRYSEGLLLLNKKQLDAAETILTECLEMARESGNSSHLVVANAAMGQLMAEQSLLGASIMYNNEAMSYLSSSDSVKYYALAVNIAISYMLSHETEKSLKYAVAAKNYYERKEMYLELALSLNNIGELYRGQFEDFDMALEHYRKAMVINKSHGFKSGLASNYLNLALTFDATDQVDSALKYVNLSLSIREEMGDVGGMAIVYNTLGVISLHKGDILGARKAYSETIRISKEYQIYPGLYYGNWGLGELYAETGSYYVAKTYFKKALDIAKNLNSKPMVAESYKSLYELEMADQNYKIALEHYLAYSAYSDSIRLIENENEFADLKTRYETDLANKENMLLKANQLSQASELESQRIMTIGLWVVLGFVFIISLILFLGFRKRSKSLKKEAILRKELQSQYHTVQQQKEELKRLNDLKNSIFSVLGHDLRAPLASISALVGLLNSGDLEPEEFTDLTRNLDQETKAGLTSLQNILIWSQVKTGNGRPQIEQLSVSSVVNECLDNTQRNIENKQLTVSTNWEFARTLPADKNQFTSIAFNLISNAVKFSPKGGEINIRTHKDSAGVYFTVSNAGEAISDELIAKISGSHKIISKRGTQGEKGTGIGLRIVSDFVELHNGHLKFRAIETGGTEVEVFFPFKKSEIKASA